ncbi:MAG: DUF302 domain-containing protein [Campylobacteraceae bacterium]|nr:DUF302 domain-containing protein [Campylobacteraceae bacterium]
MKKLISKKILGDIVEVHETKAPFEKVMEQLAIEVKNNDFSITTIHDLKNTFEKQKLDIDEDFEYKIVQICNAKKSHKVLTTMGFDLGIMMPKSIVVSRKKGITQLRFMKMKPWMVGLMFPDVDIKPMSKMVTKTMNKIVTETIKKVQD